MYVVAVMTVESKSWLHSAEGVDSFTHLLIVGEAAVSASRFASLVYVVSIVASSMPAKYDM